MDSKEQFGVCPYVTVQRLLAGKWSIYILYLLSNKPIRFNELLRLMPKDMTHTTLSRQLKLLLKGGLILRKEYNQIPPKVEYSISPIGETFIPILTAMEDWGNSYIADLENKKSS